MNRVVHNGVDTLDIAIQGALPHDTLSMLDELRDKAQAEECEQPCQLGNCAYMLKHHGMSGSFRFVLTNGPTGAIFAFKKNSDPSQWNGFVSVRALRLLTAGYDPTVAWIFDTLAEMGCTVTDHSVNRIDYAVDVLCPAFVLDIANVIAPAQAKKRPYWSKEQDLSDDGERPSAVIRGRTFESVTIGSMPNRQVILYDKRRAAIDLRQPYWFEAWDLDKDDPGARVFRVEVRAGKEALSKRLHKRSLAAVEADLPDFLQKAVTDIRYVTDPDRQMNVTRATVHPLWSEAQSVIASLPLSAVPPLPEGTALDILRRQRSDMALKQGMGNIINHLLLNGIAPDDIPKVLETGFPSILEDYQCAMGTERYRDKVRAAHDRLKFLLPDREKMIPHTEGTS